MNTDEIKVVINEYGSKRLLVCRRGRRLSELLDSEGIIVPKPCAGMGRCGKCVCRVTGTTAAVTLADESFLSAEELKEGKRLICRSVLNDDCEVELLAGRQEMSVETAGGGAHIDGEAAVAVDLGTTTIAAALMVKKGEEIFSAGTVTCANRQSVFGADVISRIAASEDMSALKRMRDIVRSDIEGLILELTGGEAGLRDLKSVVVAGNTAMLSILAGESAKGLGTYPYTPAFLDRRVYDSKELLSGIQGAKVILMPGISAFVGADILAGLYSLDILREKSAFLIDLGTNGEMALWDGSVLRVTSTAAGPVFEAGGITCGVPSIAGAICHVSIDEADHKISLGTIMDREPTGICGTGVMEAVSEFVRTGICDGTGLLTDEYFDEGVYLTEDARIRLTQKDIRNVQLGKAAILTGIKTLLADAVPDRVFLSGAFGSRLDLQKIQNLYLFPDTFNDKIISSGNTSLKGAMRYAGGVLGGPDVEKRETDVLEMIRSGAQVVELSDKDSFEADYIAAMNFTG